MGSNIAALESTFLFQLDLTVDYDALQEVGSLPLGLRRIAQIAGGTFAGPRLRGKVLPGGADWLVIRPDSAMLIDVRITLRSDADELIYMHYTGIATAASDEVKARVARREIIGYPDYYVRSTPRFETSAPRLLWLNDIIAVANGTRMPAGPRYHVFQIL